MTSNEIIAKVKFELSALRYMKATRWLPNLNSFVSAIKTEEDRVIFQISDETIEKLVDFQKICKLASKLPQEGGFYFFINEEDSCRTFSLCKWDKEKGKLVKRKRAHLASVLNSFKLLYILTNSYKLKKKKQVKPSAEVKQATV